MSTLPELVSWDTLTVLNGLCLLLVYMKSLPAPPGVIRVSSLMKPKIIISIIGNLGTWGIIPHPGKRSGATTAITLQQVSMPDYVKRAPRPFLVSGGYSDNVDRWIPLIHSVAVNRLLGYHHRVAMTNRPKHDPTPESNETIYKFFEWFLKRKTPKED